MKILIADKDAQTLRTLSVQISKLFPQCDVACYPSTIPLFKALRGQWAEIAFIIAPAVSSIGDGFKLIEAAEKLPKAIPVFLTSHGKNGELEKLTQIRGASGFLSKPITIHSLKKVLSEYYRNCLKADFEDGLCKKEPVFSSCEGWDMND